MAKRDIYITKTAGEVYWPETLECLATPIILHRSDTDEGLQKILYVTANWFCFMHLFPLGENIAN